MFDWATRLAARFCLAAFGLLLLAGCSHSGHWNNTDISGSVPTLSFSMVRAEDHKAVTGADYRGKVTLLYFGYTFCPDACPTDLQALMQGYRLLEREHPDKAAKLQPIFISVDPARDTPPVVKAFVNAFHPRLVGLTGSEAEIKTVAREYGVYYRKEDPRPGQGEYLMDHSRTAILFGPGGEPMVLVAQDGPPKEIASELARWID